MEVFMCVKRQKTSIFLDATEEATVADVKKMLEGIVKRSPEDLRLFKRDEIMEDDKKLSDLGLTEKTTKPQLPVVLGLAYRNSVGEFEDLNIIPVSTPPELPPQMKPQESPVAGS